MAYRKVWVIETKHRDPKIGFVAMNSSINRSEAWYRLRECREHWPQERFRVVSYVPDGGDEHG
jgi:hypothetical protein